MKSEKVTENSHIVFVFYFLLLSLAINGGVMRTVNYGRLLGLKLGVSYLQSEPNV